MAGVPTRRLRAWGTALRRACCPYPEPRDDRSPAETCVLPRSLDSPSLTTPGVAAHVDGAGYGWLVRRRCQVMRRDPYDSTGRTPVANDATGPRLAAAEARSIRGEPWTYGDRSERGYDPATADHRPRPYDGTWTCRGDPPDSPD